MLFISSNRSDSELRERLQEMLQLDKLELIEGEERRLDAAVKSIGAGAYDLVLGETGTLNTKSDERINRACRRADISYVRVERSRPLTCLLALAKNFGADVEQSAPRAVGAATRAG